MNSNLAVAGEVDAPPARGSSGPRSAIVLPVVVLVVLVVGSLVSFGAARSATDDDEQRILHERAAEVGALLTNAVSNLSTSLRLLGEVYAGRGEAGPGFVASAKSLVTGSVTGIGVAETGGDDQLVLRAAEGSVGTLGEPLPAPLAEVAQRALEANDLVTGLMEDPTGALASISPNAQLLVLAIGRSDGRVVFMQSIVDPSIAAPSTADSPYRELNVALYRGPTADPATLLVATTKDLPLTGSVDQRTLDVGSEQWLLVTSAKSSLVGGQARWVPQIILGVGLVTAVFVAGAVFVLMRRRAYTLALVERRTVELRQAMAELETSRAAADVANRAKSEFLSRMSHELRTPLNAVLGFAQLLELSDLDEPQRDSVEHVLRGGNHLLNLINEVLDISRIESGDLALSPESVLASEVVSETLDLMRPVASPRSVHITADRATTCNHYVFADRQRLKQILLNLVSNAIKYNRLGGSVVVSCEEVSPTRVRLRITDTGPGIRDEQLGLLFVPFERLGAHLTDVEGAGIGLALSRRLAEAMGGELGLESTVGVGSTFWIELPLVEGAVERYERLNAAELLNVDGPAAGNGHAGEPDQPPRRHRVLYIEDNLANLKLVQRILVSRPDIEIIPAMQGRLGLDIAHEHRPALILLDLHLPDTDGDSVLQQLRDDPLTGAIPVIIVSADATPGQIQRLQAAGASAYLTKPFNVRDLLRLMDELLPASEVL